MNRENILRVADAIEKHEFPSLGFNMADYLADYLPDNTGHHCRTVACIAGWSVAINRKGVPSPWTNDMLAEAMDFLGLDGETAYILFLAVGVGQPMSTITPSRAVAVLRHLAETGEVDWSIPDPASPDQPENNNG